jgi:hypothetical protein
LRGTFAPDRRASDKPIAIACLRLFTFLPLRPLLSLPRFIAFISRSTDLPAFGLYLRREDDLRLLLDDDLRVRELLLRELADVRRREPPERLLVDRLRLLDRFVAAIEI